MVLFRVPTMANTAGVGRQNQAVPPGATPATQAIVANGLAFDRKGVLYIADTARGAMWRVEVDRRGNSFAPLGCDSTYSADTLCLDALYVQHPALDGADGIALDRKGNEYVDANERDTVAVVDENGRVTELFRNPGRSAACATQARSSSGRAPSSAGGRCARRARTAAAATRPEHRRRGGARHGGGSARCRASTCGWTRPAGACRSTERTARIGGREPRPPIRVAGSLAVRRGIAPPPSSPRPCARRRSGGDRRRRGRTSSRRPGTSPACTSAAVRNEAARTLRHPQRRPPHADDNLRCDFGWARWSSAWTGKGRPGCGSDAVAIRGAPRRLRPHVAARRLRVHLAERRAHVPARRARLLRQPRRLARLLERQRTGSAGCAGAGRERRPALRGERAQVARADARVGHGQHAAADDERAADRRRPLETAGPVVDAAEVDDALRAAPPERGGLLAERDDDEPGRGQKRNAWWSDSASDQPWPSAEWESRVGCADRRRRKRDLGAERIRGRRRPGRSRAAGRRRSGAGTPSSRGSSARRARAASRGR